MFRAAAILIAALLIGIGLAAPTAAGSTSLIPPADEAASRAFMSEFGIPTETQDRLLAEAQRGEFGMANDPRALPVSGRQEVRGGSAFSIRSYADGSVAVTELPVARRGTSDSIVPLAITGCTVSSGSGYSNFYNCRVHYQTHVFSYGFYDNFTLVQGKYNDQITNVVSPFQEYAIGHSKQSWSLRILKRNETSTGPAHAELAIVYTILPNFGQITKGVRLKVGGNTYWQENS